MTVGDMRERMSQSEFLHWSRYYALQEQEYQLEKGRQG